MDLFAVGDQDGHEQIGIDPGGMPTPFSKPEEISPGARPFASGYNPLKMRTDFRTAGFSQQTEVAREARATMGGVPLLPIQLHRSG
ncbi:MAG: hypothetical protein JWR69_1372 [Pedosphaera sp.]|nr:hypothetical protein [Pedosphaera sp.]